MTPDSGDFSSSNPHNPVIPVNISAANYRGAPGPYSVPLTSAPPVPLTLSFCRLPPHTHLIHPSHTHTHTHTHTHAHTRLLSASYHWGDEQRSSCGPPGVLDGIYLVKSSHNTPQQQRQQQKTFNTKICSLSLTNFCQRSCSVIPVVFIAAARTFLPQNKAEWCRSPASGLLMSLILKKKY